MTVIRVSFALKRNIQNKAQFGTNVINALKADAAKPAPLFPELPISIKNLTTVNDKLTAAGSDMENGGRNANEAAKAARIEWDDAFTRVGGYITTAADNDPLVISLAGFVPTKGTREKNAIPDVATTFEVVTNGTKGAIIARSKKKVARAKAHIVTVLPPEAAITYSANAAKITIGEVSIFISIFTGKGIEIYNLESGRSYAVSMFSVNSAGHGPATPPQHIIPQ